MWCFFGRETHKHRRIRYYPTANQSWYINFSKEWTWKLNAKATKMQNNLRFHVNLRCNSTSWYNKAYHFIIQHFSQGILLLSDEIPECIYCPVILQSSSWRNDQRCTWLSATMNKSKDNGFLWKFKRMQHGLNYCVQEGVDLDNAVIFLRATWA